MAERQFEFPALRVMQSGDSPALILFSASAVRVDAFAGIPQKRRVHNGETVGFQRDVDDERVESLAKFYSTDRNVIANPLLCAIRQPEGVDVSFVEDAVAAPSPAEAQKPAAAGMLTIRFPDYSQVPLLDLFRMARAGLESRVPELVGRSDPVALIQALNPTADEIDTDAPDEDGDLTEQDEQDEQVDDAEGSSDATIPAAEEALFEQSHVIEFWDALRAREILLGKLLKNASIDTFLGFSRSALEAYLLPVVLVDGQHRLLGAMRAARNAVSSAGSDLSALTNAIRSGATATNLNEDSLSQHARRLPISLLMDCRPQEHVFQFVIVNQKATPVRPALLETIISSSLSEAELQPIAKRLEDAGVPLETARAVTYLVRAPDSPFHNLVARGMAEEGQELLPWSVLGQLASLFRDLKNARYFHDRKIDLSCCRFRGHEVKLPALAARSPWG